MAKRTNKTVRPDSRAAAVIRALLTTGDLSEVPDSASDDCGAAPLVSVTLRGVGKWARARGMELRDHDAVELNLCLEVIGGPGLWRDDTKRYVLHPLFAARGLWSEATGWAHDFEDDGRAWVRPA